MIRTKNKKTYVEFARSNNKGTIAILATGNYVMLRTLSSNLKVGEKPTEEDINKLPSVMLDFNTVESVDKLIKALEHVKENLQPPDYTYALAC